MGKLLFWVVLIGLVWLAFSLYALSERRQQRPRARDAQGGPGAASPSKPAGRRDPAGPVPEEMVACARCGVFLPASDAIAGRKGRYCCIEHRDGERG